MDMADEHVLGGTNVKIYYDKSTNGEILYYIGALVFAIISFGIENWINILLTTGWIFVLLISISLYSRRRYYIKREEDNIIFVMRTKSTTSPKIVLQSLKKNQIKEYYIENQKLYILTEDNTYIIDNFHVKLSKVDKIFN